VTARLRSDFVRSPNSNDVNGTLSYATSHRGAELGRRLRLDEPEAKILYCTGYSDRLFEERGTLWENEVFIDKPVTLEGLRQAVSLLLFGHTLGPDTGD
jgi:hypothetical protein